MLYALLRFFFWWKEHKSDRLVESCLGGRNGRKKRDELAVIGAGECRDTCRQPHGGMGTREMTLEHAMELIICRRDTGLVCGRSHALWPWPAHEAHEGEQRVAGETLAIDVFLAIVLNCCS